MDESVLSKINKTGDIKQIPQSEYKALAAEIRQFLVEKVSLTGGHLASNLGAVELTMGLHLALDLPEDRIIWDVGHQSYTHKILTGRKDEFDSLRQFGGLSGFPKRSESDTDVFDTGHASNSISAGLGFVRARDTLGEKRTIVSVIGDGALTGGLAYEALNNASQLNTNFIIVLNDNNRSISENVGGMHSYLNELRSSNTYLNIRDKVFNSLKERSPQAVDRIRKTKNAFKNLLFLPGMLFEELGITYLGPVDGSDVMAVKKAIQDARRIRKAVVVHVLTKKGEGYGPALRHPARFHGTVPFEIETGLPKSGSHVSWTDVFSTVMIKLATRNERVVAITAAMTDGVGLKRYRNTFPERFYDVGIAEEHAVTFAAGLAAGGLLPVVCVYSTFLQRAYDEIAEDVCMQDLPVVFAIDRGGLVGADGETHQGIFDLSYLTSIPNMTVAAPKNKWELSDMMKFAVGFGHPIAVRYPRGSVYEGLEEHRAPIELGKAEVIEEGSEVLLFAIGSMVETAAEVSEKLREEGITPTLVNARFASPIDTALLDEMVPRHRLTVTMEENESTGGFGEQVCAYISRRHRGAKVLAIALPAAFIEQGSCDQLKARYGIDAAGCLKKIREALNEEQTGSLGS